MIGEDSIFIETLAALGPLTNCSLYGPAVRSRAGIGKASFCGKTTFLTIRAHICITRWIRG